MDDLIEPRPEQILFAVVSCFFGRIVPSDAAGESLFVLKGNHKNEIARFRAFRSRILAISNPTLARKSDSRSAGQCGEFCAFARKKLPVNNA
jgi:hypothetical protein